MFGVPLESSSTPPLSFTLASTVPLIPELLIRASADLLACWKTLALILKPSISRAVLFDRSAFVA